jgi:hypothetical protein
MNQHLTIALAIACVAAPLSAQQDSVLVTAVQLATEGRGDSARTLVARRLAGLTPSDTLYPEALFAAGMVSDDAARAMNYFRRVSIEYAASAWADRALLRLAQLAFAEGDGAAALRAAEKILSDYPMSDVLPEAQFWAGRALLELGNPQDGCMRLGEAQAGAGENIELANRAQYHLLRCAALARGDTAAADSTVTQPAPAGQPVYSVQVAAVGTAVAADELMRSLHDAGYDSHVSRASDGLFKVRVGRYANRQEAQRVATALKSERGGQPFVVEEQ